MRATIKIFALFLALAGYCLHALPANAADPTPADQAFTLDVHRDGAGDISLTWGIADGNYLYRDKIEAMLDGRALAVATPTGEEKDDPIFGPVEIYRGGVVAKLRDLPAAGTLRVSFQGCAEKGICYPPVAKAVDLVTLTVTGAKASAGIGAMQPADLSSPSGASTGAYDEAGARQHLRGSVAAMLAAFLGFGVLLSLTPCVLPMIPVLTAMIAGSGPQISARRGFALSSAYVLAMAAAYGAVGLVAGWTGANLQAALQTPWALGMAATLFGLLALSMFGLFDLAVPARLAQRLSGKRGSGSIPAAALLGFGSALIVGPCVTPPLAAAMLFAVQSGEAARGGAALFALGLGMGLPLIAVGTFGARVLPRAGPWVEQVRPLFGMVFVAVAAALVTRMVPPPAGLAVWGLLALGAGVFAGAFDRLDATSGRSERLGKAAGLAACLYGAILVVGAAAGGTDVWRPLSILAAPPSVAAGEDRTAVASAAAFDAAVAQALPRGKPILVSFTADWCTVCKGNEAVMAQAGIGARLAALPRITADVTAYGTEARALMARFAVAGPPTLFLLDPQGREIPGSRLIGAISADDIAGRLTRAGA